MEMVSGGELACIACEGDRSSCCDFVSCLLQELVVVLVYGYDVSLVLYLDGVACIFAPSVVYYRSVESGLHYRSCRRCDVYVWVHCRVIALGYDSLKRCEEMKSFDGQVLLVSVGYAELLLFLDLLPQKGILMREFLQVGLLPCAVSAGIYQAVYLQRLLSFHHSSEIFGVKFPSVDHILQRIDADSILYRRSFGVCIGIARDECPYRSEGYKGIYHGGQDHYEADHGHEEGGLREVDIQQMLVRLVVNQCQTELAGPVVFIFFAHIFS